MTKGLQEPPHPSATFFLWNGKTINRDVFLQDGRDYHQEHALGLLLLNIQVTF